MTKIKINNSTWLAIQYLFGILSAIINIKLNILNYGNEYLGMWLVISSIWGFGSALDFGFATSIIKYVSNFSKFHTEKLNSLLISSFFLFVLFAIGITTIGYLLIDYFYFSLNLLKVSIGMIRDFKYVLIFLTLAFFIRYISLYFKSVHEGFSLFKFTSKTNLVYNLLLFLSVISSYIFKFSISMLSFLYLISALIVLFVYLNSFIKKIQIELSYKNFSWQIVREVFSFSFYIQLSNIFNALIDPIVKSLLSKYFSVGFVPIYEISRRIALSFSNLFFASFKTILPKASLQKADFSSKEFIISECAKLSHYGVIFSGIVFGIFSILIISLAQSWFGFSEIGILYLILVLPEIVNNFGYSIYNFILGIGRANYLALIQFMNLAFLTLFLFVSLVYYQSTWGLIGYFVSVTLNNILMLLIIKLVSGINIKEYLRISKGLKLILLITFVLLALIVSVELSVDIIVSLSLLSLLSIILFGRDSIYLSRVFLKSNLRLNE